MVEEKYGKDCPTLIWTTYQERGIVTSARTGETLLGAQLHRFRHSVATGLLNEGWSQYEVQQFLGHKSPTMMQAYAEIHDDTLREKYMTYISGAVDISGKRLPKLSPAEADVERLRAKTVRAELANGFCVLPEKQNCDYLPSPCLSCAFFRTTSKFLPIHIRQRDDSMRELDVARADGRKRAVQTHEQTIERLNGIIDGLGDEVR
jgi:integrase/recombinase XerD